MFTKVLIANRGEVALRIKSTLDRLGIAAVGVYTHQDADSMHVQQMRESYLLESGKQTGYLDARKIIDAAIASGAQAIHPGYGFLAENAEFAQAVRDAGLIFIGPSASAIASMGEKIAAREYAQKAGVPVVPGLGGMTNEELVAACRDLAFPLLVKPAAGGGGKGLHVANNLAELESVLPVAKREAKAAFGDDTLLIEKYLPRARHIEFQVVADQHGNTIHLGERECSLQRRHQKVIEEAPAPQMTAQLRERMGSAAVALTAAIGYENLGTIEFLVDADAPETFFFMEMNTRLQVEHRVTELITGLDLVECQLRIAAGEKLDVVIPKRTFEGHAIEARIYTEDPFNDFLPTGGVVGKFVSPHEQDVVVDSAVAEGALITSAFDPMLAKVIAWAPNRGAAIDNLQKELSRTVLLGVTTNLDFLIQLLSLPEVRESSYDTRFLESRDWTRGLPPQEILAAYVRILLAHEHDIWRRDGWRLNGAPPAAVFAYVDGVRYSTRVDANSHLILDYFFDEKGCWIHHEDFGTWFIKSAGDRRASSEHQGEEIVSPMPGVVMVVNVQIGDLVSEGDPLVVIEAMKMEHIVRAKRAGRVAQCNVTFGENVRVGQLLIEVVEDV